MDENNDLVKLLLSFNLDDNKNGIKCLTESEFKILTDIARSNLDNSIK